MKILNLRAPQALLICLVAAFACLTGCEQKSGDSTAVTTTQVNVNSSPAPASNINSAPAAAPDPALARVPITLPMIDALLSDDAAANELKTSAQLSDDQIQKLKDAGRDSVLQLNEAVDEDSNRSTAAASKNAIAKIREIVGADKADTVANFVRS